MTGQTYKVEQITKDGTIVLGHDEPLSKKEQEKIYKQFFSTVQVIPGGFEVSRGSVKYRLYTKNVTYLGNPWEKFKKRIQVPSAWNLRLRDRDAVLIGMYHYKKNILFVIFDKKARGKNSAAHVSSIDLLKAQQNGLFEKIDKQGNRVVTCTGEHLLQVLRELTAKGTIDFSEEIKLLSRFFHTLEPHWRGIECYEEMFRAKFRHRFQGEWPGFYAEHKLNVFLDKLKKETPTRCKYVHKKKKDDYDLDLEFPVIDIVGDLKTHNITSSAILGNDKKSFTAALKKYGAIWYVVLNLAYRHDRDFKCAVSRFWNSSINKEKGSFKAPESYCGRMKYDARLKSIHVLEFNNYNEKYISDFTQGRQPNGSKREMKIMVKKKNIDNFVIFREEVRS